MKTESVATKVPVRAYGFYFFPPGDAGGGGGGPSGFKFAATPVSVLGRATPQNWLLPVQSVFSKKIGHENFRFLSEPIRNIFCPIFLENTVQGKTDAVSARFVRKFMSKGVPKGCRINAP